MSRLKHRAYTLLNELGKRAKMDMVYLARGSFWLGMNQIIGVFFAFILAVAMANILPEDVYGNYRYILSISLVAGAFSLTGMNLALVRDIAKGTRGLLQVAFRTQLKWSLGTLIVSLGVSGYFLYKENPDLAIASFIMGIFLPIISSAHVYTPYWEGKKDYKRLSINNIITVVIYTTSLFLTIQFTQYFPLILLVYFGSQAACHFYFYKKARNDDDTAEIPVSAEETITLSKHFSFLNILSTVAAQLDKILVFHYLGAPQLAIYAMSQLPVAQLRGPFKQISQLAYPKFSARSLTEIQATIYRKMLIFTIPAVVVVVLYIFFAPLIFEIFFPKYTEAVLYSQVSMLSLLFFQKKLIGYAVLASGSKKHIYSMSIWASAFKIILLLILLPLYGIWGAIFTEIIGHVLGLVTSVIMMKKLSRDTVR